MAARVRVRPQLKEAPRTSRVILTVYEMKRLGRNAAEPTTLARHLTTHGLALEMLTGPLPGTYDPTGSSKPLVAFFAATAETERENNRESTLEGLDTAAPKGTHGGRPPVITDDTCTPCSTAGRTTVRRADSARPDHSHRQAQGTEPVRRRHLPGAPRARQARGVLPKPSRRYMPTSPPTCASSSTASSGSPPDAIRTSTSGSYRPDCTASRPAAHGRVRAGRRAGRPPPAPRSRTAASGTV
ncbi:recombinase family protein [Streptomyces sp. URMC 126]|uniref:recombinase family protein n=1 Tax=Streptomyces sp. URMC 126 TaxID=3423401 RepID=UPI003F1D40C5